MNFPVRLVLGVDCPDALLGIKVPIMKSPCFAFRATLAKAVDKLSSLFLLAILSACCIASAAAQVAPAASQPQGTGQTQPATDPTLQQPTQPSIVPQTQDSGSPIGTPAVQDGTQPDNDAGVFVFRKQVEEVTLRATVVDAQYRLVTGLDKISFTVYEDGKPQVITAFRREDVPVAIGIVIDNSGSMRDKRNTVNQALINLVQTSNPADEVFVVNFGEDYYLDQDFTSNVSLLRTALHQNPMRGKTALYDAIVASAKHLKGSAKLERQVLLVVTDGQDNASQETLREAAYWLQNQKGPTVYAIGIQRPGDLRADRQPLATLADSTGGVAFFPESLYEVDNITRTIARDIRSQYSIGYKSSNPGQGRQYRTIHVDATGLNGQPLTVRTRSGYYPGEPMQ